MNANRNVVVTGGAGRLGRRIADRLHQRGHRVTAADIEPAGSTPYDFARVDLRNIDATDALVCDAEVICHVGNHPWLDDRPQVVFNENVAINENVLQAAVEHSVSTVVFASTLQLIGSHADTRTVTRPPSRPPLPLSADTAPQPANTYALSKTVAEMMLRYYAERCGLNAVALRLPLLHRHEERYLVASGDEGPEDIFEAFSGLSYDDAADAFVAVVERPPTGFRIYVPARSYRHRDLSPAALAAAFYPEAPGDVDELIDYRDLTADTGWQPSPSYRAKTESDGGERTP